MLLLFNKIFPMCAKIIRNNETLILTRDFLYLRMFNRTTVTFLENFKDVVDVSKSYSLKELNKILFNSYHHNDNKTITDLFKSCSLNDSNNDIRTPNVNSRGGMSQTTLNSSITELFPCIAFEKDFFPQNITEFQNFILSVDVEKLECINKQDIIKTKETINKAHTSTKFHEKMENAIAIIEYLNTKNIEKKIAEVRWGYRSKPFGISSKHTGDIFIKYDDCNIIGLSLKTGGKNTSEPQLNTYVSTVFAAFGENEMLSNIRSTAYEKVYSKIVGIPHIDNFDGGKNCRHTDKKKTENALFNYNKENKILYEKDYNTMLDIVRTGVVELFNKNKDKTLMYIRKEIMRHDPKIPTIVLKVVSNTTKEITDTHELDKIIPHVKNVSAYVSKTSKQDWFISLESDNNTAIMKMSIRTNKPGNAGQKKLGQFPTKLAIKYNGLAK